jgi:hypothetical protein
MCDGSGLNNQRIYHLLLCVFHDEAEIITTALSMKCIAETEELW